MDFVTAGASYAAPHRMAIIDVGSNSFRLIVMDYIPGEDFHLSDEIREVVRLSAGLADGDLLRAAAVDRAVDTMKMYAAFCHAAGITDINPVATAAVRAARNRDTFLNQVRAETGLEVRLLSDKEEAYYGYLAAVNSTTLADGYVLDLGGGSLEIIRVEDRHMCDYTSLPFGAVRATETYLTGDPVNPKSAEKLYQTVKEQVEKLGWFRATSGLLVVGEGGTLRNLAHVAQKHSDYPLEELHGYELTQAALTDIYKELLPLKIQRIKRVAGMKDDRADISVAGAIVIRAVLDAGGFDRMTVSHQGLREGVFYERFLKDDPQPLFADVRKTSILNLARLNHYQPSHVQQVATLALSLFDQIPLDELVCTPKDRELLWAACMLHDIGVTIDYNDHHKHSFYLILNSGLPGFNHRELTLIALMTLYHRKGQPSLGGYKSIMQADDDEKLLQMTACLRLAEQLDRSRDGVVSDVILHWGENFAQLEVVVNGDGVVAVWSVLRHADIFFEAFGRKLEVVTTPLPQV